MLLYLLVAMPARKRGAHPVGDGEGLPREHGGLVGDAHAVQIPAEIESRRDRVAEARSEGPGISPLLDERTDLFRFRHVANHQVFSRGESRHLACGSARLFVEMLA